MPITSTTKDYDGKADAAIDVIAALAWAAVASDEGAGMIARVFKAPWAPFDLDDGDVPALCVYRGKPQKTVQRDSTARVEQFPCVFEYTLPSANLVDERETRWPALHLVWRAIQTALVAGGHSAVDAGADVLGDAGITTDPDSPTVATDLIEGGREGDAAERPRRPFFRGTILVEYEIPLSAELTDRLAPFKRFYGVFTAPGDTDAEFTEPVDADRIRIDLNLTLEGYSPWPPST